MRFQITGAITQLQSFFLCVIQVITLCFSRPSFLLVCFIYFMFPRRFQNLEERVSIFLSIRATTNHITKRKSSTHLCGRNTEDSSTGASTQASCRVFIYIAYLLNRHGNSCNPCHAEKARHCLVCHAAPRGMVPNSRGCGSVRVKRRNTPCLGDCQENTTLSGGGQPPPLRKSTRLVGIMSLATGSPCLLDNKRGVITTRQELTLAPKPDPNSGKQCSETALCFGEFFQRSDASLLVICRTAENNRSLGYLWSGQPLIPGFLYSLRKQPDSF